MAIVREITVGMVKAPEVPTKGNRVVWESTRKGFGIRVSAAGGVSFLARYWNGKKDQWVTLGRHPKMTLTEARAEYAQLLRRVDTGGDPVAEDRAEKRATLAEQEEQERAASGTVKLLGARWLEYLPRHVTRRGQPLSPRSIESYTGSFNRHVLPAFGSRLVADITRADVVAMHEAATKRGGTYAGNRAVNAFGVFLSWCESIDALPVGWRSPTRHVRLNPEMKRGEHAAVRLSRDQEARLVAAIEARMVDDPIGATALLVLLDTGRRHREVLAMRWSRIDLDAGIVDLGRTKGKVAGDTCYLPPRTVAAIRRLPRIVGVDWVFSGHGKDGRRAGLQSAWEVVKREAGLEAISTDLEGFHIHDLRHHRISELLAVGVAPQLVARQVGHTSLEQLKTYGHLQVHDVAAVLSRLASVEAAPTGAVVPIEGGR